VVLAGLLQKPGLSLVIAVVPQFLCKPYAGWRIQHVKKRLPILQAGFPTFKRCIASALRSSMDAC
jgi:hypothetical protein